MALHAVLLNNIKIGMKAVHNSASHAEKNLHSLAYCCTRCRIKKKEEKMKKET